MTFARCCTPKKKQRKFIKKLKPKLVGQKYPADKYTQNVLNELIGFCKMILHGLFRQLHQLSNLADREAVYSALFKNFFRLLGQLSQQQLNPFKYFDAQIFFLRRNGRDSEKLTVVFPFRLSADLTSHVINASVFHGHIEVLRQTLNSQFRSFFPKPDE